MHSSYVWSKLNYWNSIIEKNHCIFASNSVKSKNVVVSNKCLNYFPWNSKCYELSNKVFFLISVSVVIFYSISNIKSIIFRTFLQAFELVYWQLFTKKLTLSMLWHIELVQFFMEQSLDQLKLMTNDIFCRLFLQHCFNFICSNRMW